LTLWTAHDSVLFFQHREPFLQTNCNAVPPSPPFLNSPCTTISQNTRPLACSPSYENHCSPYHIQNHYFSHIDNRRLPPSLENRCSHLNNEHQSPLFPIENQTFPNQIILSPSSAILTHIKSFSKITLPSTKDIPILTGKHDWGPLSLDID
jgi:hypothetical protein